MKKIQCARNNVCFECRQSARSREFCSRTCPQCNQKMTNISYRWRIPSKNDNKSWKEMQKIFVREIKEEVEFKTIGHRGIVKRKYNRAANKNFKNI